LAIVPANERATKPTYYAQKMLGYLQTM